MPSDILERTPPAADHRLHYGSGEFQFGDLRLPPAANAHNPAPVVVFLHGGWWKAKYSLEYAGHLCEALRHDGVATWSLEYRRVGDPGGGFPGTFQDVAAGYDFLLQLGKSYPLDLRRVVVMGHSAGGHLAFWACRAPSSAGDRTTHACKPLEDPRIRAVIALAGAVDLRLTINLAGWFTFAHDKQEVYNLMDGSPAEVPERYRAGNPGDLLPLEAPQFLLQGTEDDEIPPQLPQRWADRGRSQGERVEVDIIPGADHLDLVDPLSKAWPQVVAEVRKAFA